MSLFIGLSQYVSVAIHAPAWRANSTTMFSVPLGMVSDTCTAARSGLPWSPARSSVSFCWAKDEEYVDGQRHNGWGEAAFRERHRVAASTSPEVTGQPV